MFCNTYLAVQVRPAYCSDCRTCKPTHYTTSRPLNLQASPIQSVSHPERHFIQPVHLRHLAPGVKLGEPLQPAQLAALRNIAQVAHV